MLTEEKFSELAEKIKKNSPAEETEISYLNFENSLTRFSNNFITQNVVKKSDSVSILLVKNGKTNRVDVNSFDDQTIQTAIKKGMEILELSKEHDDFLPLPQKQVYQKIPHSFYKNTATFSPEERAEAIAFSVGKTQAKGLQAAGIFSTTSTNFGVANSNGVFAFHNKTNAEFSLTTNSETSYGWANSTAHDVSKIKLQETTETAIQKCLSSQNPQSIDAGDYDVILEPTAFANILGYLNWNAFGTLAFLENRSFLSGKLGEKIFGENVTVFEDPYDEIFPGTSFDFEGMPKKTVKLVEKGVAKEMVQDRYTAQKMQTKSTGHALPFPNNAGPFPTSVKFYGGNSSLQEMIETTERGLLVTHFHYTNTLDHFNLILTGMTRDGLWLVENGKITKPVKNLRFTDSMVRVLNNVELLSKEVFFANGSLVCPAAKVKNFHFSSKTER
ncbi:TldD/PmbA family protein [bacterium]|nr:TldD/PmbA family protein [bacterium]